MTIKRTLTLTALIIAGALTISFVPSLNAEAQPRRPENAQTCSQNGKSCKKARPRRAKRGNEQRRPRKNAPDFWETQRQNQRG